MACQEPLAGCLSLPSFCSHRSDAARLPIGTRRSNTRRDKYFKQCTCIIDMSLYTYNISSDCSSRFFQKLDGKNGILSQSQSMVLIRQLHRLDSPCFSPHVVRAFRLIEMTSDPGGRSGSVVPFSSAFVWCFLSGLQEVRILHAPYSDPDTRVYSWSGPWSSTVVLHPNLDAVPGQMRDLSARLENCVTVKQQPR